MSETTVSPEAAAREEQEAIARSARAVGIPVIEDPTIPLDTSAVRAVPTELDAVGVAFHEGYLVVAFRAVPTPGHVNAVQARVGMPVHSTVAPGPIFDALQKASLRVRDSNLPVPERILEQALRTNASDIHLSVGTPPVVRAGGMLIPLDGWDPLSADDVAMICEYFTGPIIHDPSYNGDMDLATVYGNWRFRCSIFRQRNSFAAALRVIPDRIPAFKTLGLPANVERFAQLRQGLVLVCGVTGSGKSTTLASIIDIINQRRSEHIITLEDPIEYLHASKQSLIQQREIGEDSTSFAHALRASLRQDPDVILVGEMRDHETIQAALHAAETGHLVLSTIHATDARGVIDRIIDVFPANEQEQVRTMLGHTLEGVICQSLVPSAVEPGKRHVICEVMFATSGIKALIREGNTHQIPSALQTGIENHGMVPFDLSLARAVRDGLITAETGDRWSHEQPLFRQYLSKLAVD
ncbi:MAG: type IV pilus twitching motility protein PilT [Acidimicrobiia bacterium]